MGFMRKNPEVWPTFAVPAVPQFMIFMAMTDPKGADILMLTYANIQGVY